jgi:hypothetical protein
MVATPQASRGSTYRLYSGAFGVSPKQAAVAIIEDQNATHSKAGMTISPVWIGQSKPATE